MKTAIWQTADEGFNDRLAVRLKLVAHPVRLRILETLSDGSPKSVAELARLFGFSEAYTGQHVGLLFKAGILKKVRFRRTVSYDYAGQSTIASVFIAWGGREIKLCIGAI